MRSEKNALSGYPGQACRRSMADLLGGRTMVSHGEELVCQNLIGLVSDQRFNDWRCSVLSNNLPSWKLCHCRVSEYNCDPVRVLSFTRNQSTTKLKLHVHLADASSWDTIVKIGSPQLSVLLTPGKGRPILGLICTQSSFVLSYELCIMKE